MSKAKPKKAKRQRSRAKPKNKSVGASLGIKPKVRRASQKEMLKFKQQIAELASQFEKLMYEDSTNPVLRSEEEIAHKEYEESRKTPDAFPWTAGDPYAKGIRPIESITPKRSFFGSLKDFFVKPNKNNQVDLDELTDKTIATLVGDKTPEVK